VFVVVATGITVVGLFAKYLSRLLLRDLCGCLIISLAIFFVRDSEKRKETLTNQGTNIKKSN